MGTLNDKANISDIRKKKNKIEKNIHKDQVKKSACKVLASSSYKCCFYCQKVFFNSKFLLEHIFRRHSDDLILLYENYFKCESNNNSSDLQYLASFLQKEFLVLKKELSTLKLAVGGSHDIESAKEDEAYEPEKNTINICGSNQNIDEYIDSNEVGALKEKIYEVEKDVKSFSGKLDELDDILKNEVLMKQNVSEHLVLSEEKKLQALESKFIELKQILLSDLKSLLFNQQQENSSEWKSQLLELRHEIKKLDYIINAVKQQSVCTHSLQEDDIKKICMKLMVPYLIDKKSKSKQNKTSRCKAKLTKGKIFCLSQQKTKSDCDKLVDEQCSMITEKLAQLSIASDVFKLSHDDFNDRLKLLSAEKEVLSKKHANFSKTYDTININANHKAHNLLESKKCRKIRFSEPLTSTVNSKNSTIVKTTPVEDHMQECSPLLQDKNQQFTGNKSKKFPESEFQKHSYSACGSQKFKVSDLGASGDCFQQFSNKESMFIKHPEVNSASEVKTSSPVKDIQDSKNIVKLSGIENLFQNYSSQDEKNLSNVSCKLTKANDNYNDDFDDVSSLESYNFSDD